MKFHALLPVRDEADIIEQCLTHLLTWCDAIYVFDTGSVDNTWEIVLEIASNDNRVITICKEPVYYCETRLRGYMFQYARQYMEHGDWFLRVDADEFHHILPPEFVKTQLHPHETIVYHQYYDFCLTTEEVTAWEQGLETVEDRKKPIAERRRHFIPSVYSEPRMCRYRSTMKWPINCSFPVNAGFVAQKRLPIRHYPNRDPLQLERRCRLRAIMMADETNRQNWARPEQHHWSQEDWRKFIVDSNEPKLQYWEANLELPVINYYTNHLKPPHIRFVQRLVHSFCLPILDRQRPSFPEDARPQPIPEAVNQILTKELQIG